MSKRELTEEEKVYQKYQREIRKVQLGYDETKDSDCNSKMIKIAEKYNTLLSDTKNRDRLLERLKIEPGETTPDGKFSIEETRCVGACGLAPVFTVNGEVYGKATPELLEKVIDEYMNK